MKGKVASIGPRAVTAYIAAAPPPSRLMMRRIRAAIKAAAPRAEETMSYGTPYYSYRGRLAYFAAFRRHVSVFMPGRVLTQFAKEIKPYWRGRQLCSFRSAGESPWA